MNALADRGEGTALRVETAAAATREREREKESIPQSESLTNRFGSSETKYDRQIQIVKIQMRVKAMLHFRCGPIELPSILAAVSVLSRWRFPLKDSPPSLRAP